MFKALKSKVLSKFNGMSKQINMKIHLLKHVYIFFYYITKNYELLQFLQSHLWTIAVIL